MPWLRRQREIPSEIPSNARCTETGEIAGAAMRLLYTVLLWLALPLLVLRLFAKSSANRDYLASLPERFGLGPRLGAGGPVLWIHAVSVGEVQAAVPLIQALRSRYPNASLLLTTATPTGRARARQIFGDALTYRYIPFDLPPFLTAFFRRARPAAGILMETELWPNLVSLCAARSVPLLLANARLSERSAKGYQRVSGLTREMLSNLSVVGAQSDADAKRLVSLGARTEVLAVTGNMKLDVHVSASAPEAAQVLRRSWGQERSVWIAASTHPGEEEMILKVHQQLLDTVPDCLLVLVPRHPERADGVEKLCKQTGLRVIRRSRSIDPGPAIEVYLGDTLGELLTLYAAADVAFVGGTLVEIGGHNLLEPAALGLPVVLGPHTFNFFDLTRRVVADGVGIQVDEANQLKSEVQRLLTDAETRHEMGERGRRFVADNRGALKQFLSHAADSLSASLESC